MDSQKPTPITQKQPWGAVAALMVGFGAYVLSQLIMGATVGILQQKVGAEALQAPWVTLVLDASSWVIMLGLVWLFLRSKKFSLRDFGFARPKLRQVGLAALAYALYFLVYIAVVLIVIALVPSFNADEVQDTGFIGAQGWQLVLAFFGLVIVAPVCEEIFFRGFLYRGLRRSWPMWLAAIGTSGLFALAHGQWNVAIDVFILSLLLIFVYQKTGNLWLCIGMHATKNLIAFLFLFVFGAN